MRVQRWGQRKDQLGARRSKASLPRMAGLCGLWLVLLGAGGNLANPGGWRAPGPQTVQAQEAGTASSLRQRQLAFLHRLRQADPRAQTIDKAILNEQNELGVILDRRVEMDAVRPLMRTLLIHMAKAFPRQDLMVMAYTPTTPPMPIGTARLNARTRQRTYTPAMRP